MHRLILGLIALMVAGCADSDELIRASGNTARLPQGASAYIALPADGSYGQIVYRGSGIQTAKAIAAALGPHLGEIAIAEVHETIDEAKRSAADGHYDYLMYPEILHWEDRATEWSGKPDIMSINISVIRPNSGAVIDSSMINGRSGPATFGGDHPQDLLAPALQKYSTAVFG